MRLSAILAQCWYFIFSVFFTINAIASDNGVILVYHHVSADTPASTSVSPETFREHLEYLSKHHVVIPLADMVTALSNNQPLPDKAVSITFDDGHLDILQQGHPLLKEFNFPYTIFVNPELVGVRPKQLNWDQLRTMQQEGATIANHSLSHQHLLKRKNGESQQAWLARQLTDIDKAEAVLREKLGSEHKMVAYPYGEYNLALKEALREKGYVGFGQHSGAIASFSDFGALPRFAAAGIYANLKTLSVKLNSLAMPVVSVAIPDPEVAHNAPPPEQALTLSPTDLRIGQLNCFFNGRGMQIRRAENTVLLTLTSTLPPGRTRINCTAPSKTQSGRYYWYSQPWFVPTEDGNWLE